MVLFDAAIEPKDPLYRQIRDDPKLAGVRIRFEQLWDRYQPYADPGFPEKISQKFHDHFWEMNLACILMEKSHRLATKTTDKGPDISVVKGNSRVWIEAVAPERGTTPDAVPLPRVGGYYVSVDRILLRLRSVIHDKREQHARYLRKGIVSGDEPYVIAINAGYVPDADTSRPSHSEAPYVVQAVSGLGTRYVRVDSETLQVVDEGFSSRATVSRARREPISTDIFLRDGYEGVSGILYSATRALDLPAQPGSDFIYVHNSRCACPLPKGWLACGYEFWNEGRAWYGRCLET